jgi:polyhydroxyalkanoate synthesis regulator phasin
MSFKGKDYLNNIEIKAINDPSLTDELKAVLNGDVTNNTTAKHFAELIQNGLVSNDGARRFVEMLVAKEENAAAQLEAMWG